MVEIHKSKDGQFFFIVKARNGKTLVTSEMYKRKHSAFKGVEALLHGTLHGAEIKDLTT